MSYPGLILDERHAKASEELGHEVVLFVVERRAAKRCDAHGAVDPAALLVFLLERRVARLLDPLRDALHRPLERDLLPLRCPRGAVLAGRPARRIHVELKRRGALGAQRPAVDGGSRIALDVDDGVAAVVDEGRAADRAVGTDARGGLRIGDTGTQLHGALGEDVWKGPNPFAHRASRPFEEIL